MFLLYVVLKIFPVENFSFKICITWNECLSQLQKYVVYMLWLKAKLKSKKINHNFTLSNLWQCEMIIWI